MKKLNKYFIFILFICSNSFTAKASLLKQIEIGSTPVYAYGDKKLQDLSGSAYVNGYVYLASDGGKNSNFPEIRISSLKDIQKPSAILQRQIVQRDIEGSTQIGNTIYVTSSMSQVNEDTDDYRVLSALTFDDSGKVKSEQYIYARQIIVNAMEKNFGNDSWLRRVKVSFGKSGGINIEGLSHSHNNGDNLIFGFRSPLWDESFGSPILDPTLSLAKGKAILLELKDPMNKSTPEATFTLIDLNGQGIRGIEYIPELKGYVIISGGVQKLNEYHLWFYDPMSKETTKLSKLGDDFSKLCRPESVLNVPEKSTLIIFSEESGSACSQVTFNFIKYQY
jgi:hypothetical protein